MTVMLLEWVFTSLFLILTVLALRAAFGRRVSARLRYALWVVVLVRLLVPVQLFTSPLAGTWVITEKRIEQHGADWSYLWNENPVDAPAEPISAPNGAVVPFSPPEVPALPDPPVPPAAPDLTKAPAWLGWIWLGGSAVMVAVLLWSNLRFARRLRRCRIPVEGTDCPLPVYAAVGLPSPCLFGLVRPGVYVTPEAAADPVMLRHVVAHEYTHFRQGDHLWSFLRCAALAVHWWNPLVWVSVKLSRRDGELACDEGALKRLGDGERMAYGNTLLALVTAKPGPGELLCFATTMAGDKKSLKERVSRIACAPKRILWAALAVVLVTALACACAFGTAAEPDGQPIDPGPVPEESQAVTESLRPDGEQYTDLNRNGIPEDLRVTEPEDMPGSSSGQRLEVWEDGKMIWADNAGSSHAGYNAVFLCTLEGKDYLLRYNPYTQQGGCDYSYKLFTLSEDGEEQAVRESSIEYCISFPDNGVFGGPYDGSFDPEKIAAFMDEINGLLANSVELINTDIDLLGTFQDAGRLVDDLWWLDIWKPVFTRDPSKSLLENLRAFEKYMCGGEHTQYQSVLLGRADFALREFSYEETWRDAGSANIADMPALFGVEGDPRVQITTFAVVDMDGDGTDEVLVWICGKFGYESSGYLLLHQMDGKVYGAAFDRTLDGCRWFLNLKTDGTFLHRDTLGTEWMHITSLQFDGLEYHINRLASTIRANEGQFLRYLVNGQDVSLGEFDEALALQSAKPDVVWHEFTEENINAILG